MADYLPPVVARLQMDLGDFAAKIAQARAMMQGLGGDFKIGTDGLDAAAAKVKALQASLQGLSGTVKVNTDGLGALAAKTAAAGAAGATMGAMWVGGLRLTATALHWIVAGGAEILAVTIPALVALGAGIAVAAQGGQMVQQHFAALYTTSEATANMFHTTAGQILGMGDALQTAQNAANPAVYGILGSALITVKEHFGDLASTGLQVVQMFQGFSAKVATEFGPGGSLGTATTALLSHMVADLQGLGQVFGNLGHAVLSFGAQMPGLAELLLKGLSGITGLISAAAQLSARFSVMGVSVLTAAMGFEEFNRWGGLLASMLTRVGLASASLSGGVFSLTRFGSVVRGLLSVIPTLTLQLGMLFEKIGAQGAADGLAGMAASMEGVIAKINPGVAIAVVAASVAIGFLVDKLLTARSAAQQFGDTLQAMVMKASNATVMNVLLNNIGQLNAKLHDTSAVMQGASRSFQEGNPNIQAFNASLAQQKTELANVVQGAAYLAKTYGTSFQGALALADEANVKLASGILGTGQAAMVARMQVASLVQGYQAMGAPTSAIGSDMQYLAIQSGLASTQVSQLNSAFDQFMQNLTGGTSGLASLVQSLQNIGNVVGTVRNNLGQAANISLSTQQFANALKNFGTTGAQAWTNFNQVVGSTAPQLIDWMRTAGAEGALSGTQFKQGVLDMASALVPLASQSKTAQAEVLGLVSAVDPSINTWPRLQQAISAAGASMSGLGGIVGSATQGMANMDAVTAKLGNVLSTALVSALQAAQVQASGAGKDMEAYAQALMDGNHAAASADYANVIGDLERLGLSAQQAAALIAQVTQNLKNAQGNYSATFTVYEAVVGSAPSGILPTPTGHATGTPSAPAGWAWVGERGPELVRFTGGEVVLPHQVSMGFAGGTGTGGAGESHTHIYLDGRQIYSSVASQSASAQRRTGHSGMTRRTR